MTETIKIESSLVQIGDLNDFTKRGELNELYYDVCSLGWPSLTRRFDKSSIMQQLFCDTKVSGSERVVYVGNETELSRFKIWLDGSDVSVRVLPVLSSVSEFSALQPGLLALHPEEIFVVPGGRFQELYGWDSYFMALGILNSHSSEKSPNERFSVASGILKHLVYQIRTFGRIHNANRSYFVNRSNPPFLTSLIKEMARFAKIHDEKLFSSDLFNESVADRKSVV